MAEDPINLLERELDGVRREFERYFLGLEKRLPGRSRGEITKKIRRFDASQDGVSRFRHQNLLQRLMSFERYWDRILRQIEEGTFERDIKRADFRDARRTQTAEAPDEARREVAAKKAATVGDAAADFLASLGMPMRGQPKAGPASRSPAVSMRGSAKRAGDSGRRSLRPGAVAASSARPASPPPSAAPSSPPRPPGPASPRPPAPPRGVPVSRPLPNGALGVGRPIVQRPIAQRPVTPPPKPAAGASFPPLPPLPPRGRPVATRAEPPPPAPPMRGAPKGGPAPPMRGRPIRREPTDD